MTKSDNFPRRVWDWMVVSLPLLTVAGLFSTVMILLSLFGSWGLSGIQLITPQDAVIPGFAIGYLIATIFYLPFALAQFIGWFSNGQAGRLIVTAIGWLLLAISVAWGLFAVDPQSRLLAAFLASSSGILLLQIAMRSPQLSTVAKGGVVMIAGCLAVGIAFWILGTFGALLNQIEKVGLARGVYVIDKEAACMGKVLWWGERALVIRCSVGSEEIRVMTPKEGLRFGSERELVLASKHVAQ